MDLEGFLLSVYPVTVDWENENKNKTKLPAIVGVGAVPFFPIAMKTEA